MQYLLNYFDVLIDLFATSWLVAHAISCNMPYMFTV